MSMLLVILVWITAVLVIRLLRSLKVDKFSEKTVFITGCDTGFGHELAIRLDCLGFHVFAGCLTEEGAKKLSNICSTRVAPFPLDVSNSESVLSAKQFVQERLPQGKGIWALVNNAGIIGNLGPFELNCKEDFVKVLNVNLLGPADVIKQFLPLVRKSKGRIVNITSSFGRFPGFGAPYCTSKFGMEALSDIIRREVYDQGIKVSIIEPGGFPTSIGNRLVDDVEEAFDRASPEVRELYQAEVAKWSKVKTKPSSLPSSLTPVIDAYTHAIVSRYPRNRYVVGKDAQLIFIPLSYLPDWISDWLIRNILKPLM